MDASMNGPTADRPVLDRDAARPSLAQKARQPRGMAAPRPSLAPKGLEECALAAPAAGYGVGRAFRVADLRRRRVAGAHQVAVDRVRHDLVSVRVGHGVVPVCDRPEDGVANEPGPETVVALDGDGAIDETVFDRRPRYVEGSSEGARATGDEDAFVDRREVDLHRSRVGRVNAFVDRGRNIGRLFTAEDERC